MRLSTRRRSFAPSFLLACLAATGARCDQQRPIPDAITLMKQVQTHQRALDKTRESYTFRERQTISELDKAGNTKKVERRESEVFFVNSHELSRLVGKDGRPLSSAEQARETERLQKEVQKRNTYRPASRLGRAGRSAWASCSPWKSSPIPDGL